MLTTDNTFVTVKKKKNKTKVGYQNFTDNII